MIASIGALFALYVFSTSRRLFTLEQVKKAATDLGAAAVLERVNWALAHAHATRRQEALWRQTRAKKSSARGRAAEIDNMLDRVISGIYNGVLQLLRTLPAGSERAQKAERFLAESLPEGADGIAHAEFEDALGMIEELNADIDAMSEAELVDLNIAGFVPQLVSLTPDFKAELERTGTTMRFAELAKARKVGHDRLCLVVAAILDSYPGESPADVAARDALLAPILGQNERVRESRKLSPMPDPEVDPKTGEDVDRDALDRLDREELDREPVPAGPVTPSA